MICYDMIGSSSLLADDRVYHLSLTPDTPGLPLSGPNLNKKNREADTNGKKKNNFLSKLTSKFNNFEIHNIGIYGKKDIDNIDGKNKQNRLDLKGIQDFSDGAKVRVTLEELHNGGRTFLAESNSENILSKSSTESMDGKGERNSIIL